MFVILWDKTRYSILTMWELFTKIPYFNNFKNLANETEIWWFLKIFALLHYWRYELDIYDDISEFDSVAVLAVLACQAGHFPELRVCDLSHGHSQDG